MFRSPPELTWDPSDNKPIFSNFFIAILIYIFLLKYEYKILRSGKAYPHVLNPIFSSIAKHFEVLNDEHESLQ